MSDLPDTNQSQNDWTVPKWSEKFLVKQGLIVETHDLMGAWAAATFLKGGRIYKPEERYLAHIPRLLLHGHHLLAFGATRQDVANEIVERYAGQPVATREFHRMVNGKATYRFLPLVFSPKPLIAPVAP